MGKKRPSTEVTEAAVNGAHVPQTKKTKTCTVKKNTMRPIQQHSTAVLTGNLAAYGPLRDNSACVIVLPLLNGLADFKSHRFYQSSTGSTAVPPVQQNLNKLFDNYRGEGRCSFGYSAMADLA